METIRDTVIRKRVEEPGIEKAKLVRIEAGGRARQFGEIETRHELVEARMRRDRIGGPERCGVACDRERLDAAGAQAFDRQRPVALRERLPVGPDEEAVVPESGRLGVERLK